MEHLTQTELDACLTDYFKALESVDLLAMSHTPSDAVHLMAASPTYKSLLLAPDTFSERLAQLIQLSYLLLETLQPGSSQADASTIIVAR